MKKIVKIISLILIFVLAAGLSTRAYASEENRKIIVTGRGIIKMKPDIAKIRFRVETEELNQKLALDKNSKKMNDLIKELKKEGVGDKDMHTGSLYIYSIYKPSKKGETVKYYVVENSLVVKLGKLEKLNKFINIGVKHGVEDAFIEYDNTKHKENYNKAIDLAIKDANKRADIIAKAVGGKIKSINRIREIGKTFDMMLDYEVIGEDGSINIPLNIGDMQIEALVEIEYLF